MTGGGQRLGDALDQLLHEVHRLEHQVHVDPGQLEVALAAHVQQVLGLVGQFLDGVQLGESGQALDGVEAAEHGVQGLGLVRVGLDGQQVGLRGVQMLGGLADEVLQQPDIRLQQVLGRVVGQHHLGQVDRRSGGWRGRLLGDVRGRVVHLGLCWLGVRFEFGRRFGHRLSCLDVQGCAQAGQQIGDLLGHRAFLGQEVEARLHPVEDLEQPVDARRGRLGLDHVLGHVAQLGQGVQAQQARLALEGMEPALQFIDGGGGHLVVEAQHHVLDVADGVTLAADELGGDGVVHEAGQLQAHRCVGLPDVGSRLGPGGLDRGDGLLCVLSAGWRVGRGHGHPGLGVFQALLKRLDRAAQCPGRGLGELTLGDAIAGHGRGRVGGNRHGLLARGPQVVRKGAEAIADGLDVGEGAVAIDHHKALGNVFQLGLQIRGRHAIPRLARLAIIRARADGQREAVVVFAAAQHARDVPAKWRDRRRTVQDICSCI